MIRRLLLPDGTLVERKLFTFQDVTIAASTLTRSASHDSVDTTGFELPLDGGLDFAAGGVALLLLLLDALALLDLLGGIRGSLSSTTNGLTVMGLIPLPEGRRIDLDHGGFGQGVGTDEFVVGRMVGDGDDTDFAGDALAAPGKVAGVDAKGAEFAVATARAHEMDALGADPSVGRLATFLESSVLSHQTTNPDVEGEKHFGLCIPLLTIVCALGTGGAALVTRVTRDTVREISICFDASMESREATIPHGCGW